MPLTVPYKCTKGITPAFTTGSITPFTQGVDTMAFTVNPMVTTAATGFDAAVNGTSAVNIAAAVCRNAPTGAYTGSVVLNINN